MMTGVDMVHVPYRGRRPSADRPHGRSGAGSLFGGVSASIEHIKAGKLRALAVTTAARLRGPARHPDGRSILCLVMKRAAGAASSRPRTPLPKSSTSSTRKSTPALPTPRSRRGLPTWAARRFRGSPADFGKFIADETEKWGKVVKFGGHQARVNSAARTFHNIPFREWLVSVCVDDLIE